MKQKGFTLIELLAVIVILAIVLAIAIPSISNIIENSQINALKSNNKMVLKAVKTYVGVDNTNLPKDIGETTEISLETLQNEGYITEIQSPSDKSKNCNGYVLITKVSETNYDYTPHLNCESDIGSSVEDGLVGYWKLDGNAYDYSLNNNHGTIHGATTVDNGLYFDGIDDYIDANIDINVRSVSLWLKVNNIPANSKIIFVYLPSKIGLGFFSGNSFILKSGSSLDNARRSNLNNFNVGEWNHIVINYSLTGIPSVFINNVEADYLSNNYWTENNSTFLIACRSTGDYFNGAIDDIRIYNRALSEDEVKQLYNISK